MRNAAGILAIAAALAIFLGTGSVHCDFQDDSAVAGNTFTAFSSSVWIQTTHADFVGGSGSKADIGTAPDEIALERGKKGFDASGSFRSPIYDTGCPDTVIDLLSWNATTPESTSIMVYVRASDKRFSDASNSPEWIGVGAELADQEELPGGQYLQWRADLATSNCSESPVLYEVQVWYH